MPTGFLDADTGFPELSRYRSTEAKLDAVQNYLFLLLENLRYVLRNLSPDNFNEQEVRDWLEDVIQADTVISNTVITNELYADYGAVADLTVDRLRTDYDRARRYLAGDSSSIDYLYIHDEVIDFLTDTCRPEDGPVQLTVGDRAFWWLDETKRFMSYTHQTQWPVMVYQYDTLLKGSLRFSTVDGVKIPNLVLGAGYGDQADPLRGRGFIRKNPDSFDIWLRNSAGNNLGLFIGDSYADLAGLRKPTEIDFSGWESGSFSETYDGGLVNSFAVTFDAGGRPVRFTDGAGHATEVVW